MVIDKIFAIPATVYDKFKKPSNEQFKGFLGEQIYFIFVAGIPIKHTCLSNNPTLLSQVCLVEY